MQIGHKKIKLAVVVLMMMSVTDSFAQEELATIPVQSQDDGKDQQAGSGFDVAKGRGNRMMEEIIVTAQKREQNIQDVPQAVTAFSPDKLEAMGVQTVQDLQKVTPGLTMTNEVGFNVVFLRGVGTDAFLPGADSSVPFYVDGIPLLATQGSSDAFGKIQRVEVLKGPQGTLFGTNSVGGAVNIITPDPEPAFNTDLSLGIGNYGLRTAQGSINVPVTSGLGAILSAYGSKQDNFYINDDANAPPTLPVFSGGVRLKARWDITDNISQTLSASWQQTSSNGGLNFENTHVPPAFALILPEDPKADRHLNMNSKYGAATNMELIADTFDWRMPWVDMKVIGSYQHLRAHAFADFDGSSFPLISATTPIQVGEQYTAELQFSSVPGTSFSERLTWVGGLFYIDSYGGFNPVDFIVAPGAVQVLGGTALAGTVTSLLTPITDRLTGIDLNNGIVLTSNGVLAGTTVAEYAQGTLKLTDSVNLILGQRFQHTHRDLENSQTAVPDPNLPNGKIVIIKDQPSTLYANQFSPRVGLQWYFAEEAQLYASWARGYKSPTYNTVNIAGSLIHPIKEVLPTRVDAYELGVKSELFDHTLQLNSAAFYTKEKNLLTGFISVLTGGIVSYDNVPAGEIKGAEVDAVWQPLPHLDRGLILAGSATYLDAKYTDYPNGRGYDVATGLPFGDGFPVPPLPARDFTGNQIVRTPKLSYNASITQQIDFEDSSLELSVDCAYSSGLYFLPQDEALYKQKAHYLFNAHATYIHSAGGVQVTLWGKNLANTSYDETQATFEFGRMELLNDPRTFGVTLKWTYQ